MKRAALAALALAVSATASAAPRKPYGGDARVYVFGRAISVAPENLAGPADATVQGLVYERLYALDARGDLVPVLASGPPTVEGIVVKIPVRARVSLHDGRPLTAAMVAEALARHAAPDARSSYVAALAVDGRGEPRMRAVGDTVEIRLTTPHRDFARLLASPHAAIDVPAVGRAGRIGSGPFEFASRTARGVYLFEPFTAYRDGRPFLDRVEVRPHASRFGAAALTKNEGTTLVFGVPDAAGRDAPTVEVKGPAKPPSETLVLAVGPNVADAATLTAVIDGALNRERLARRFLGADARPTRTLLDGVEPEPGPTTSPSASRSLSMLVSRDSRAGHRFAERVQFELLRAGITARLERVTPERLESRRRSQDFELLIDTLTTPIPESPYPADALHALWSFASAMGRPDVIRAADVERFERAQVPEEVVEALEPVFREALRIVPIARRTPSIARTDDLRGVTSRPSGAMDLADAHR